MIDLTRICIISGDFNLNYLTESSNIIIKELHRLCFKQMMDEPTHMQGGIIDHLYIYCPPFYKNVLIKSSLISAFYTDHFGIHIKLFKKENEFKHIESSVPDYLIDQANEDCQRKRKKTSGKEKVKCRPG